MRNLLCFDRFGCTSHVKVGRFSLRETKRHTWHWANTMLQLPSDNFKLPIGISMGKSSLASIAMLDYQRLLGS
jgi:hypothetical protein